MKNSTQEVAESLAGLRAQFETLAEKLKGVAEVLRSPGKPPAAEVAAEVNQARQSFLEICNRIEKLQPRTSASIPTSLDEIENELRQLGSV